MQVKKHVESVLYFLVICLLVTGCARSSRTTPLPLPTTTQTVEHAATTVITPTITTPQTTIILTEQPAPTPARTPTPTTFKAQPANDGSARLRSGPSVNHDDLGLLPPSTELFVTGRTPDKQWVQVRLQDGRSGWISLSRLTLDGSISDIPIPIELDAQIIQGRVLDSADQPVAGVRINAIQTYGLKNLIYESVTGEDGWFYFFLPEDSSGTWIVEVVGILCESRIAGPGCVIPGEFEKAGRDFVSLPQSTELTFVYQHP